MWKCREIWLILILGLFLTPDRSEGRAVNISNTWTLPQEGFTVFYRFFRDKISWFEADAVCQFHHANLVTVENSHQFDASRNFLQVLDVIEPVWIGLMRAQNSKRFAWSNSKPLPSETGYWAEPLPIMDSPLCAVIDPTKDFRWHSLRCGGPETASFLCEMNVPSWADECTIKEIPSLTIQYMADSGSVELSKDCGDEGTIHQICKGKQDMDRILKELVCKTDKIAAIDQNSITSTDLANTHYKSLEIIKNVPTDNDEDNNISTQPKKINSNNKNNNNNKEEEEKKEIEQNPVQKLIEQFNVEELMQADQPHIQIPDEIPKPVKKTVKKAKAFEKKDKTAKKLKELKTKEKPIPFEDIMMGDQPAPDDIISESEEPLPHIKKSLPQDLRHLETTTETLAAATTTTTSAAAATTTVITSKQDEESTSSVAVSSEIIENTPNTETIITTPSVVDIKPALIGHPMHPHQPRDGFAVFPSDESGTHSVHIKESGDNHFIPPMLLVKSHYTSTKSHLDTNIDKLEGIPHHTSDPSTLKHETIIDISTISASTPTASDSGTTDNLNASMTNTTNSTPTFNIDQQSLEKKQSEFMVERVSSTTFEPPTTTTTSTSIEHHQIVEIKIGNSDNPTTFSITTRPIPTDLGGQTATATSMRVGEHDQNIEDNVGMSSIHHHQEMAAKNEFPTTRYHDSSSHHPFDKTNSMENQPPKVKNKFSNEENFQPFKPNRRRSLTKPETTTYLKKILG